MGPHLAALNPPLLSVPKLDHSLRRIHRDVRFSPDKRPSEPRPHLIFPTGPAFNRVPGVHLVLTPEGLGYGAGHHAFTPETLEIARRRICLAHERAALLAALDRRPRSAAASTNPNWPGCRRATRPRKAGSTLCGTGRSSRARPSRCRRPTGCSPPTARTASPRSPGRIWGCSPGSCGRGEHPGGAKSAGVAAGPCQFRRTGLEARHFTGGVRACGGEIPAGPPVAPDQVGGEITPPRRKPERNKAWRFPSFPCVSFLKLAFTSATRPSAGTRRWASTSTATATASTSST